MIMYNRFLQPLIAVLLVGCGGGVSDKTVDLPGDYQFVSESVNDKVIVPRQMFKHDMFVPCSVQKYVWNSKFILAKQKATKECFVKNKNRQSIGEFYYWVILVQGKTVLGPLSEREYIDVRGLHGVPEKLSLKD